MAFYSGLTSYGAYLEIAITAAKQAGEILVAYWDQAYTVHEKNGVSNLVTEVDHKSEQSILATLKQKYPHHATIAEESYSSTTYEKEFTWVIDPLDGTTNYTHRFPLVCISIGLLHKGLPVVGVIYNPILKELYHTSKGAGSFLNDAPIKVSTVNDLSHSLLATGFAYDRHIHPNANYAEFQQLTQLSQGVRRLGSAALDLAFVASGRLDGYWERGLKCWDIAAGILLVEEACGQVSSYDMQTCDLFSGQILATNGHIHAPLSQLLTYKSNPQGAWTLR